MSAGLGAGFFATIFFFAGVAFFIPFVLRAGAPRFAFLDFFAFVFCFFFAMFSPRSIRPELCQRCWSRNHTAA